jgi:predicted RNA-binding Zn-ribbon protein involved in translation (DUF1610 family)
MSGKQSNDVVPTDSTTPVEDELASIAQNLACPECGEAPVELVRILSPDETSDESVAAFKGGLAGALLGGVAGSIFGPAGVGLGMAGGALAGSDQNRTTAQKERLVVSCSCCGYHGRAV